MQNLPSNKCNTYGLNSTSRYFSFFPRKNTSATKIQESVWRHQCICIGMVSQCSSILSHLNYQTRCDWCVKRVNFRFLKFGHVSKRANILLTMNGRTRNLARGLHNGLTQRPLEHELRLLESSEPIPPRKQQNQGSKYTRSNHKDHPCGSNLNLTWNQEFHLVVLISTSPFYFVKSAQSHQLYITFVCSPKVTRPKGF